MKKFAKRLLASTIVGVVASQAAMAFEPTAQTLVEIEQGGKFTQMLVDSPQHLYYRENLTPLSTAVILPLVEENEAGMDISLRVQNDTSASYYVEIPSESRKVFVPLLEDRTVYFDLSSVAKGEAVPYYITNADGERLAGGYVYNGRIVMPDLVESASQSEYDQWGTRLQQLIAANEYRPPVLWVKEEPKQHTATSDTGVVRGFW